MEVVVEILRISNKIKSGTDLRRHSQLPTPNSQLPDKFQFIVTGHYMPYPLHTEAVMNGKTIRTALSLILVAMYIAGLAALCMRQTLIGVNLWVISTVASLGLLYWIHVQKKREEDAEKIAKGMPYGEPDDPNAPVNPVAPPEDER